jgi:uncharacterized protein
MLFVLLILAGVGHAILWAAMVNRLHGLGAHRRWIDLATMFCAFMLVAMPIVVAVVLWQESRGRELVGGSATLWLIRGYLGLCALNCLVSVVLQFRHWMHVERRGVLRSNHTTRVDVKKPARFRAEAETAIFDGSNDRFFAPGIPALLGRVPGNQVLDLHVHKKQLTIPRLTSPSSSLRIAHVSDFHMSGRIAKEYYVRTVEEVNRLEPDLIAVTGDLVEFNRFLDWLPDTLGRLRAKGGVYFVRGNHDRRVDNTRLVAELEELGLIHLGGKWLQVEVDDVPIVLAGNELPWYIGLPSFEHCPQHDNSGLPLRILLAHGPDQFGWATHHGFDLVLAGHNHGGQVRLPLVGAILAPSLSGTRYAGGVFRRDNTVLHVSRGTASLTPFRWNCPPEIALLELCGRE